MHIIKLPRDWVSVFGMIIIIYLLINLLLPRISSSFVSTYIVQPLSWGVLAYYILRLPKYKSAGKMSLRSILIKIAAGIALFQVYLSLIMGLFEKFGRSPNSFTFKGILINLIFASSSLLGMEISRAWLINRLVKKPVTFIPSFVALIYAVFCIPLSQISKWGSSLEEITRATGSTFLPTFVENLLASFLAMWGGALPALTYRGILQAYTWFCPILPDLNWAMKALVGTVVPIVGLVIIQQVCLAKINPGKFRRESGKGLTGWIVLSVVSVIIFWFSMGVFPVRPTVIVSGSMRPAIEVGDMAIVGKVNVKLLKVGDIIQFREINAPIPTVHRIIDTCPKDGKLLYMTKGDANDTPDSDLVIPEQVVGKVIFVLPKAGWATIAARQMFK